MLFNYPKIKRARAVLLIFFMFEFSAFALEADLVVINADVRTIDRTRPRAGALAVTGNRISAIGGTTEIRALIGSKTNIIDARGKLLLPGFNDAHVHFTGMGNQFFSVDLRGAKSAREMIEKIRFHARFVPKNAWILGNGWNDSNWTPNELPTKDLIDASAPEHPVFLYHANGKSALVNSLALKTAKIEKSVNAAPDNEIARDAAGEPTGILRGAAMNRVRALAPRFATDNKALVAETASNYAAAFGVTSVQDMSADDFAEIYRALESAGRLKTRIYDCTGLFGWQKRPKPAVKNAGSLVRQGCLKGFSEGDADSEAALFEEISAADKAGLQVMIHAIGARSNAQALSVFERVVKINGQRDRRFRVEHAHGFRPSDVRRFAASDIIASVQPFLFSDAAGGSFDPLRDLLNAKAALAFGSDASLIPVNPLSGIAAAAGTNDPRRKITVEEAVRAYTLGAAFAEFQESEKGSLTVGKLADFVILSDDIFSIPADKISRTQVLTTVVDGKIVYRAD
jgi:predicted amidohydrolase YtcJ